MTQHSSPTRSHKGGRVLSIRSLFRTLIRRLKHDTSDGTIVIRTGEDLRRFKAMVLQEWQDENLPPPR